MENDHVFHGEHTGVCHGIALSMCYGNQGYIDLMILQVAHMIIGRWEAI